MGNKLYKKHHTVHKKKTGRRKKDALLVAGGRGARVKRGGIEGKKDTPRTNLEGAYHFMGRLDHGGCPKRRSKAGVTL